MRRVLILAVNSAYFAVPIETVHQVMRNPMVTQVPLSPAGLLGLVNVRGEIVPLLDAGVLTGTGALHESPFAVLVSGSKDMVALAAEELPIAADFEEPVGPGSRPGELGVYSSGGRLVGLIAIDGLAKNPTDMKWAS